MKKMVIIGLSQAFNIAAEKDNRIGGNSGGVDWGTCYYVNKLRIQR